MTVSPSSFEDLRRNSLIRRPQNQDPSLHPMQLQTYTILTPLQCTASQVAVRSDLPLSSTYQSNYGPMAFSSGPSSLSAGPSSLLTGQHPFLAPLLSLVPRPFPLVLGLSLPLPPSLPRARLPNFLNLRRWVWQANFTFTPTWIQTHSFCCRTQTMGRYRVSDMTLSQDRFKLKLTAPKKQTGIGKVSKCVCPRHEGASFCDDRHSW